MRSPDFPSVVEPRLAAGGALSERQHSLPPPGTSVGHDIKIAAATVTDILERLRTVPGVNIEAFDRGRRTMLEGLQMVATSMKRQ